jgi:hypothetical protein
LRAGRARPSRPFRRVAIRPGRSARFGVIRYPIAGSRSRASAGRHQDQARRSSSRSGPADRRDRQPDRQRRLAGRRDRRNDAPPRSRPPARQWRGGHRQAGRSSRRRSNACSNATRSGSAAPSEFQHPPTQPIPRPPERPLLHPAAPSALPSELHRRPAGVAAARPPSPPAAAVRYASATRWAARCAVPRHPSGAAVRASAADARPPFEIQRSLRPPFEARRQPRTRPLRVRQTLQPPPFYIRRHPRMRTLRHPAASSGRGMTSVDTAPAVRYGVRQLPVTASVGLPSAAPLRLPSGPARALDL